MMEHLCNSATDLAATQSNRTFVESVQAMTDCSFSFFQLVTNCVFIYCISLLLIYRVYCAPRCGANSRSRFSQLIKSRRKARRSVGDSAAAEGDVKASGKSAAIIVTKTRPPPPRRRNSKSLCSNISDNVFESNLRTISESESVGPEGKHHVVATLHGHHNYEVEYQFDAGDGDAAEDEERLQELFEFSEEFAPPKDKSRQLLRHHILIWIATFVFVLIVSAQLAETAIVFLTNVARNVTSANSGRNVSGSAIYTTSEFRIPSIYYLRLFSALSSFLTLFWTLFLFQHVETTRALKLLWINISYFVVAAVFAILHLHFYFYTLQLTLHTLKPLVHFLATANALLLILILFYTFIRERRVLRSLADNALRNVKYLHYHTSILSRLVFFWFTAILRVGYRQPLEGDDLGILPPEEKTQHQFERFNAVYSKEREKCDGSTEEPKREFSLWKCLFKTLGSSLVISGVFRLLADLTGFVAPLGIRTIVRYVGSNKTAATSEFSEHLSSSDVFANGYVMAFVILLSAIMQSTFSQCSTFLVNSEGIHIKVALQALIYKKSLTLSPTKSSGVQSEDEHTGRESVRRNSSARRRKSGQGRDPSSNHSSFKHQDEESSASLPSSYQGSSGSGFDTGSILNILSEDTNNIMMFFWMVNFIWAIPLKLTILMGLLYLQLGFSALIGAGICILIMIPLQFYLGRKMSCNSKELMEKCDDRLRSMSEILQGMKLLKLQGWELLFGQQIIAIREKELKTLDRDLLYRSIMTFLTHISSVLVTVVTFGLYSYIESDRLEPSKVFAGLALFNQLTVPLFIFPITVPVVIDALVSAKRVREFLLMPEAVSYTICDDETNGGGESETNSGKQALTPDETHSPVPPPSPTKKLTIDLSKTSSQSLPQPPQSAKSLKLPKISDIEASTDSVFFAPIAEEHEEEDGEDDDAEGDEGSAPLPTIDMIYDIRAEEIQPIPTRKYTTRSSERSSASAQVDMENNKLDDVTHVTHSSQLKLEYIDGTDGDDGDDEAEDDSVISILNGDFSWEDDRHDQTLTDISVRIPSQSLTILVGKTGSGKSSFVSALLGEMRKFNGELRWKRDSRIAYAAQKPWILNGTVKENILFGKSFKGRRYKKAIDACSLQPDIDLLPARENTEIGERGINLSGGQKQRIAIARALYSNADVVILDDPLSALDVEVAHHVFSAGILRLLLKSHRRTVILVTHHLPVLPHAHQIIAMEKGCIRAQGTYKDIEASDPKLFADWKRIMTKKKEELQNKKGGKTAKERWSLLKNFHKAVAATAATRPKTASTVSWTTDEEKKWERYKKKKEIFSHHKTLSHEYRPGDECYYEEIMEPLLCHHRQANRQTKETRVSTSSYSKTHPSLSRMTSLQVETKGRSPTAKDKIQRLQSLQSHVDEEPMQAFGMRARSGTNDSAMSNFNTKMRRILFSKSKVSSAGSSSAATEMEKLQPQISQRLVSTISADTEELPEDEPDEDALLMSRESSQDEREYGFIPPRVYLTYIGACGRFLSAFYVLIAIGYEVVHVYTNFWLKEWSDEVGRSPDYQYDDIMRHYFLIYVILSIITVLVSLTSNIVGKQAGANSREKLHRKMFDCIIRCPVRFFDSTPIGRILNRFASDMAVVDRKLCVSMQRFLQFVFLCISAIVVNAIVNPWFLIVAIPIVIIYYGLQRFYRFSSRELHRIEAISRGPIFSHFHETLEGLSTIRAYGVQRRFTNQMLATIDVNNTAAMFINCGNRWLSISLDYLGSVIVFMATFVSMISSHLHPDVVTPSMVGLAINYTLLVPIYLNHVVKFLAEVEMFMNSVDRIDRFSKLETEEYGDELEAAKKLPAEWPARGEVVFDNVSIRYSAAGPKIVDQLNAKIKSEQKVGICGRSGSGKSTLLMALFRISEICDGKIEIDGIDVKRIPLLKLRSRIAIIPQENILFSGTIRFNLDPQSQFRDVDIWHALELCQMKFVIQDMPGQLDAEIKDSGAGFSAGQKQLLGLARAILHKTKLIIMDEATSSVDLATETTLLQVVSEVFKDSTVLTIAHRLSTITGGDRILVLDGGRIVEDGAPKDLLAPPPGIFATMLRNSNE